MPSVISSEFMSANVARRISVATPSTETSPWIMVNALATVVAKPTTTMKVQATCSLPSVVAVCSPHQSTTRQHQPCATTSVAALLVSSLLLCWQVPTLCSPLAMVL